ncbi:uncharacterized protein LOC122463517 [Chelonia mydas]|uniref:uncharacterized protein LOC122463517 n=1 Tax=Chelonia mydas TaxID=8469 RepID=UPI001CA8C1BA|nr:uncharacterized protein LOC122463517 [Chelonia mydas]
MSLSYISIAELQLITLNEIRLLYCSVGEGEFDHALLSGTSQCFENYQGTRFYGIAGVPHGTWAVIHRKLIPLLKSLVQTLEENKRRDRSLETLILQSSKGYSSRSTLKASTAQSEAFRTAESQEIAPTATLSPVLPSFFLPGGSHVQQEILTRLFLEKHASELVHLELSLMTEEINMICYFYESAKDKEECKENWVRLVLSKLEVFIQSMRNESFLISFLSGFHFFHIR